MSCQRNHCNGGKNIPMEMARKLPKPMKAPPRIPITKVFAGDRPALLPPVAAACTASEGVCF